MSVSQPVITTLLPTEHMVHYTRSVLYECVAESQSQGGLRGVGIGQPVAEEGPAVTYDVICAAPPGLLHAGEESSPLLKHVRELIDTSVSLQSPTVLREDRETWQHCICAGSKNKREALVMRILTLVLYVILYVGALPQSPTQREPDRPWKRNSHRPDSRYSAVTPWLGFG